MLLEKNVSDVLRKNMKMDLKYKKTKDIEKNKIKKNKMCCGQCSARGQQPPAGAAAAATAGTASGLQQ